MPASAGPIWQTGAKSGMGLRSSGTVNHAEARDDEQAVVDLGRCRGARAARRDDDVLAAQSAPVPEECKLPGLSAEAQARCDFIASTPDLCERPNLSGPTRAFCEQLREDEDDCTLSERGADVTVEGADDLALRSNVGQGSSEFQG